MSKTLLSNDSDKRLSITGLFQIYIPNGVQR